MYIMTKNMLFCAGVDHKDTPLSVRSLFAFDDEKAENTIKSLCKNEHINGCVILSTCNRSEIYILSDIEMNARSVLLESAGVKEDFGGSINIYKGVEAVYHIMETACGINSAIRGESQIITQISQSADMSRGLGLIGSELDVLFRTAVSTGRSASLKNTDSYRLSSAHKAVELLENKLGGLKGKKCLVIGNGKVGLLCAGLLAQRGADTNITLRSYKHGESTVPAGCKSVAYSDRLSAADGCDALISATKSPHFTLTASMAESIRLPKYIVDLAVPADIERGVYENRDIEYYNIDMLASDNAVDSEIYDTVEGGVSEYMSWYNYRESLEIIEKIKYIITRRILASYDADKESAEFSVSRAVDMLLGGIKENITPESLQKCYDKIKGRARL